MKSKIFGLFGILVLAISCSNSFDEVNENSNRKGSLVLSISNRGDARTIFANEFALSRMTFTLSGKKNGKAPVTIKEGMSYSYLIGEAEIRVDIATWDFTLDAYYSGVKNYSATVENVVIQDGENSLKFDLKEASQEGNGEFSVSLAFPNDVEVEAVKAALLTTELVAVYEYENLSISNGNTVVYAKTSVTSGIYIISFKFFYSDGSEIKPGYSELIHIKPSCASNAERTIADLENLHSIKYNLNGGGLKVPSLSSSYNASYGITLPSEESIEKTGYTFSGWYESEAFEGEAIEEISAGTNKDLVLWAKWTPTKYTITYEGIENATNSNPATYTIEDDEIVFVPPVSTTSDRVFAFWVSNGKRISSIPAGSHGDIVITARWRPLKRFSVSDLPLGLESWLSLQTETDKSIAIITGEVTSESLGLIASVLKTTSSTRVVLDLTETIGLTEIGTSAFKYCHNLVDVILPATVTSIADFAFYNCSSLESMLIPSSVTLIGYSAFTGCTKLSDVHAEDEFKKCAMLITGDVSTLQTFLSESTGVTVHYALIRGSLSSDGLKTISEALKDSSKMVNLDLNEATGVQTVEASTFASCTSLKGIVLPRGMVSIKDSAFSGCSDLEKITIYEMMKDIGSSSSLEDSPFYGCNNLKSVHINQIKSWCGRVKFGSAKANPLYYARHVFVDDSEVNALIIPYGVTSICDYAFYNCSNLTSVEISDTVTTIGGEAFYKCSNLKSVKVSSSVTTIGDDAFSFCNKLTAVYAESIESWCGISFANQYANPLYYARHLFIGDAEVTALEIPSGVTSISAYAFYNCSYFRSVKIPSSVASIGNSAFYQCSGLTKVYADNIKNWCGISFANQYANPLYYARHLFVNDNEITALEIPSGVTSIGAYAFYYGSSFTSVKIPATVTSIGNYAFYNCTSLTTVYAGNLINWFKIAFGNEYANPMYYASYFWVDNYDLTKVIKTIDKRKLLECLSYKIFTAEEASIGLNSWLSSQSSSGPYYAIIMENLTSSYMTSIASEIKSNSKYVCLDFGGTNGLETIGYEVFKDCTTLESVVIPDSVTTVDYSAFRSCTQLDSITIPSSVTEIKNDVFVQCGKIKNVYADTVESWCGIVYGNENSNPLSSDGSELYIKDSMLTELVIPNNVSSFSRWAFRDYRALESVVVPSSVEKIEDESFRNCIGMKTATISVKEIGASAFSNCTGLTDITMKSGVEIIGKNAFDGCKGLTKVTIPVTSSNIKMEIRESAFSNCENLNSVYYNGSLSDWCKIEFSYGGGYHNYFLFQDNNPLCYAKNFYVNGSSKVSSALGIPSDVVEINPVAFYGCKIFTSVKIPARTNSIGYGAFRECENINSITFENTSGWYYGDKTASTGTTLDVTNVEKVKEFLNSDEHRMYYLLRK